MKLVTNILLYLLVGFYLFMGSMHLIQPGLYTSMIPVWLPAQKPLIILSGITEIALALLMIPLKTRTLAAKLIVAMLVLFLLVIHIPESVRYHQTGSEKLVASIARIPLQFLFIAWAWVFTKNSNSNNSD